jgi:hypothetical protein
MRKSVKLAAASAIAAVALVGGSATAATAAGHDDEPGFNICGNGDDKGISADDNGEVEDAEIESAADTKQTVCQVGKNNEANVKNETEYDGGLGFLGDLVGGITVGV